MTQGRRKLIRTEARPFGGIEEVVYALFKCFLE